jgi:hypothetical protein
MKYLPWILGGYLLVVGAATIYSGTATSSPTADTVAGLPSLGSLLGSTGTTAGVLDLAGAAAAIWLLPKVL